MPYHKSLLLDRCNWCLTVLSKEFFPVLKVMCNSFLDFYSKLEVIPWHGVSIFVFHVGIFFTVYNVIFLYICIWFGSKETICWFICFIPSVHFPKTYMKLEACDFQIALIFVSATFRPWTYLIKLTLVTESEGLTMLVPKSAMKYTNF